MKKATSITISTSTNTTITSTQAEISSPLSDNEDEPRTPKTRSLRDLYEAINKLHLVCLLTDAEDITFEQVVKDENARRKLIKFKDGYLRLINLIISQML